MEGVEVGQMAGELGCCGCSSADGSAGGSDGRSRPDTRALIFSINDGTGSRWSIVECMARRREGGSFLWRLGDEEQADGEQRRSISFGRHFAGRIFSVGRSQFSKLSLWTLLNFGGRIIAMSIAVFIGIES